MSLRQHYNGGLVSYTLFLDDERSPNKVTWVEFPQHNVVVVRSHHEFVNYVTEHGIPEFVCFDHDLCEEHYYAMFAESTGKEPNYGAVPTGLDSARWLGDHCHAMGKDIPRYVVHSMNPFGKERIHLELGGQQWQSRSFDE
jgi:hypothetical protein